MMNEILRSFAAITRSKHLVLSVFILLFHRPLQQVLHLTPDHAGELIHRLGLGFVDVVDPLHALVMWAISLQ